MKRSTRHRAWKWFWIANLPVAIAGYFLVSLKILVLYTLILSVTAMIEASAAAEFAAESTER